MNTQTKGAIFDFSEISLDYNFDLKLKQILDKLHDKSKIEVLGLAQNKITPDLFDTITQSLNPESFTLLDTDSRLTPNAADSELYVGIPILAVSASSVFCCEFLNVSVVCLK